MPKYFAEIDNQGTVLRVIVADSLEWCIENQGGQWKETFMDDTEKNYARLGDTYDSGVDNFISEKPYPSWVLNEKQIYVAPIPRTDKDTYWDEPTLEWVPVPELKK